MISVTITEDRGSYLNLRRILNRPHMLSPFGSVTVTLEEETYNKLISMQNLGQVRVLVSATKQAEAAKSESDLPPDVSKVTDGDGGSLTDNNDSDDGLETDNDSDVDDSEADDDSNVDHDAVKTGNETKKPKSNRSKAKVKEIIEQTTV